VTTTVLAFIPSPSQGVWHIGFVPIRAYALCIIVGIMAALIIGDRRWEARGGERGVIYDVALWAVPFGLIGGRLYHVMTDSQKYFGPDGAGFFAALRIWDGGLGIWGAVALGGVGAWIACRRRGIPLPAFGDAIAPGIILAQAIGRLGNYFNQELYGRETDLPWGLTIYDRLDPTGVVSPHSLDGVSTGQVYAVVHPTFLYELLWNVAIFALLLWADRRFKLGHGRLFALYVAGYCVGRFWVELMRSDTATLIAGIRVNSFTSTFVFIGAVIYIMVAPKGREAPESLRGKDADESFVDEIGEGLVAVAATSGVVAAAKVAGDEDKAAATTSGTGPSTPDGDDADAGAPHSEAAAENEDLIEQVETAPSEDIAEAEAFAAVGDAADEPEPALGALVGDEAVAAEEATPETHEAVVTDDEPESDESTAKPTEGLGSVDGDEVDAAESSAAEAHAAAVEGADSAETTADDVADEPETVEPETDETPESDESTAKPTEGLGSVDGDEVDAAESSAAEAHAAAVEGADSAETTADDVADEPETVEPETDETPESGESTAKPTEGLGSVDGGEVDAAKGSAAEAHAAAVEGADSAETTADDVADEPESDEVSETEDPAAEDDAAPESGESTAKPTEGLGSVDGDEVDAAESSAAEAHAAAVEGADSAETTADDIAAEPKPVLQVPTTPTPTRRRWWRRS
jgi:prolipoprotein diacylglyceryl transferase